MADEEDDEKDPLEEALQENAKLKAENARLKKNKKGETDPQLKEAEKRAKLTGHRLKAAKNLHEIQGLTKKKKPPSAHQKKVAKLKHRIEIKKLRKEDQELGGFDWSFLGRHWVWFAVAAMVIAIVALLALSDANTIPQYRYGYDPGYGYGTRLAQQAWDGFWKLLQFLAGLGIVAWVSWMLFKVFFGSKGHANGHGH